MPGLYFFAANRKARADERAARNAIDLDRADLLALLAPGYVGHVDQERLVALAGDIAPNVTVDKRDGGFAWVLTADGDTGYVTVALPRWYDHPLRPCWTSEVVVTWSGDGVTTGDAEYLFSRLVSQVKQEVASYS